MSAYVIAQIEVHDPDRYADYVAAVPATIEQYGGKYIVRGGEPEMIGGKLPYARMVVIEFPSVEQARTWAHSPEYTKIAPIRESASDGALAIFPGVE